MPQDKAKSSNKGVSKAEAVRRALDRLGAHAKPLEIKPYLQHEFGINMSPGMISSYKSSANKKAGQSRLNRRGGRGAGVGNFSMADIQAVKHLTERIGAEKVRELAGLFG